MVRPGQTLHMVGTSTPRNIRPLRAYSGWEGEGYLRSGESAAHLVKHLTPYAVRQHQLLPYFQEARGLRWLARGALLERAANSSLNLSGSLAWGLGPQPIPGPSPFLGNHRTVSDLSRSRRHSGGLFLYDPQVAIYKQLTSTTGMSRCISSGRLLGEAWLLTPNNWASFRASLVRRESNYLIDYHLNRGGSHSGLAPTTLPQLRERLPGLVKLRCVNSSLRGPVYAVV